MATTRKASEAQLWLGKIIFKLSGRFVGLAWLVMETIPVVVIVGENDASAIITSFVVFPASLRYVQQLDSLGDLYIKEDA